MQVSCCQVDTVWEDKQATHAQVKQLLESAAPQKESLVVLPEYFATGFSLNVPAIVEDERHETQRFLSDTARDLGVYMLGGVVNPGRGGRGRNELVAFDPQGQLVVRYCKLHLFSFAGESERHDSGDAPTFFQWGPCKVSPFICYDLRFPEVFRASVRQGAQMFIIIANWPQARHEHWLALARARAIENQAYVVTCNRCGADPSFYYAGASQIIDPQGNILSDAGSSACVISAPIDLAEQADYRRRFTALDDMRNEFFATHL